MLAMALCISGDFSLAKVGISFCIFVHFHFAQNSHWKGYREKGLKQSCPLPGTSGLPHARFFGGDTNET
jgi:hypothetical protein